MIDVVHLPRAAGVNIYAWASSNPVGQVAAGLPPHVQGAQRTVLRGARIRSGQAAHAISVRACVHARCGGGGGGGGRAGVMG